MNSKAKMMTSKVVKLNSKAGMITSKAVKMK